tara:strand:+ start:244 stop:1230 length:987 start_codon:yes stop_codon:yes gene_type:complete
MYIVRRKILSLFLILIFVFFFQNSYSQDKDIMEILKIIQKDIKTLEKAVYSDFESSSSTTATDFDQNTEDVLTRHLLKLSELENQFNALTNKFEEINFKLDKLSTRLSKVQADNQLRFQQLENINVNNIDQDKVVVLNEEETKDKILPGTSEPQDIGEISYKDTLTNDESQKTQSIETTQSVVSEIIESEERILPDENPEKQYEFASSLLKVGDYNTAERAFLEFIKFNPEHNLAGNAQYWYAETFRIRQLYTDAASAYLEGYQKYPKSSKAPINLLKLGVSMVQIGEKEEGCRMITGVKEQYPKANQSVLQKAKYEEKKFGCKKNNT